MTATDVVTPGKFDGETVDPELDAARLSSLLHRVLRFMAGGAWHTLGGIAMATGGSEAGVSARLRDLRKVRFGGWTVEKRRKDPEAGLWEYRLLPHDCAGAGHEPGSCVAEAVAS